MGQGNGKMKLIDIEDDSRMTDSKSDNENDDKLSTHTALTENELAVTQKRIDEFIKTATDEKITCNVCKQAFTDSVADQVNRIKKGWDNKPKRCKPCNEEYKKGLSDRPRPCIDFSRGHCAWGDSCKFIHGDKPNRKLGVHHCRYDSDGDEEQSSGSDSEYSDESSDELDPDCY